MSERHADGAWGIGPAFGSVALVYALAAWGLTARWPELFRIELVAAPWLVTAGGLLLVAGAWLYVRALRVLRRARRAGRLATDGPYARVRHPVYAIWLFVLIPGAALVCRSWLVLSAAVVGYVLCRLLLGREEAALAARHGQPYTDYCRSRNRFLPLPRRRGAPKGS